MEILKNLELIDVVYNDNKATLIFLDEDRGEIREVNFNKQVFKDGKFVDDADKANKVEKWCDELFGLKFNTLTKAIGEKRDIYAYEKFNSLFEINQVEKFGEDMVGQIFESVVKLVSDDGISIKIEFMYEGKPYETKMTYSEYIEAQKKWFVNPQKRLKQYEKFKEKFHLDIKEKDKLIGQKIMVEVKKAFGKFIYADIKPFPKKKK